MQAHREELETALHAVDELFKADGVLSGLVPDYEVREEQWALTRAVLEALFEGRHLLAEAATGTGKSFAYLIAAALYALKFEETVLISTHTLHLQTQLLKKDLPIVHAAIRALGYDELTYELAKGRSNYICRRRFAAYRDALREGKVDGREKRYAGDALSFHQSLDVIEKIAGTLDETREGLRDEFPFAIPYTVWQEIAGDVDDCLYQASPFYDRCFIQHARRRWSKAHLIVANHALVFADLALKKAHDSGVLPGYARVIFDEGHHVQDVFSRYFARTVSISEVDGLFRMIEGKKQAWMEEVFTPERLQDVRLHAERVRSSLLEVMMFLDSVLVERDGRLGRRLDTVETMSPEETTSGASGRTLLLQSSLTAPSGYRETLKDWLGYLQGVYELESGDEAKQRGLARLLESFHGVLLTLDATFAHADADHYGYWLEYAPPAEATPIELGMKDVRAMGITIHAEPLSAASILGSVFRETPAVILSATLSMGQSFDFVAASLGLEHYQTFFASSPFNYEENALFVISETAPDPREEGAFIDFLENGLKRILTLTEGRTLVLFTNYKHIRELSKRLASWFVEKGLTLLEQHSGDNRDALIRQFQSNPNSVLFGNDSFWEGIDVPGAALSCVVVTKLPFANPQDPRVQARFYALKRQGRDAFMEWSLPEATLKLKQGVGRLLRSKQDRGVVVFMDPRLRTKRYGKRMLQALPPARIGTLKEIPRYVPSLLNINASHR
ncbi:MAG: DinG family ATP-dependent helicase YoaA [Candidatus Carbobacillus altaicus]|uniref:DinG family ATP-dependent helicase YoaA n=1 Tax=Candidatus Carbonibacillus altaicus TaxID=2163959 RepID=A0A2R6XZC6_9BACL|nr:MAG: DinG family ATP-dependent helicase YoaA [Candidatus Carbobacillus altaicus]